MPTYNMEDLFVQDEREGKLGQWVKSLLVHLRAELRSALRRKEEAEISRDLALVVAGERTGAKLETADIIITLPDGAQFPFPAGAEIDFVRERLVISTAAQGGIRIESGSSNIQITPITQFEVRVFAKEKD